MNICQHSKAIEGKCYISKPNNLGNLKIIFSDSGVGIVSKIKAYYKDYNFEKETDCIEFALKENITTKSIINNQGAGLHTVKKIVESMNGILKINCQHGFYENRSGKISKIDLKIKMKGTTINILLNINNFEKKEISDYSNTLEF
jgi:hypothetical protein